MITIIGGGTMGVGIATSFLIVGETVLVVESQSPQEVPSRISDSLTRLAKKSPEIDPAALIEQLTVVADIPDDLSSCTLAIEAIPEILDAKSTLFETLSQRLPAKAIIATNTSSLPVSDIISQAITPERCIGMHFFNPVPVSSLVEIVVADATAETTVSKTQDWVERLGKTPIVVQDSPGFASSRLGVALGLEAIRMVEAGVASATDIDTAMQLGYRHPMGPLKLTDLVGIDIRLAIAEHLANELGPRFEPPQLMRDMVAQGKLGKKSGSGFYEWE